jgi:hypothetical protein
MSSACGAAAPTSTPGTCSPRARSGSARASSARATFGRAAAGITRGLLSVAGRAPVALGAKTSIAISVGSGAGAGLVSGGVSGSLAGAAGGAYAGMRGGGDAWDLASSGAAREGIAGMAAGLVGGALFQGSLRAGVLPSGTWGRLVGTARRPPQAWGGRSNAVIFRGLASPAGLGLVGAGFASGFTGGLVNHLQHGGEFEDGLQPALDSAAMGAVVGLAATALSPVSFQYWRARSNTDLAAHLQRARRHTTGRHHQRNVAQYPEYSSPTSPQNSWLDNLATRFTRGNISGPSSIIPNEAVHAAWHRQWGAGRGLWSQVSSHGPWTPAVNLTLTGSALPTNHNQKAGQS